MTNAHRGQHVTPTPAGCAHYQCMCLTVSDDGYVVDVATLDDGPVALVEFAHPFRRVLLPLSELVAA